MSLMLKMTTRKRRSNMSNQYGQELICWLMTRLRNGIAIKMVPALMYMKMKYLSKIRKHKYYSIRRSHGFIM